MFFLKRKVQLGILCAGCSTLAEEDLEEGSFEDNGAQLIGAIHFQELPSLIEILVKMIRIVNILTMMMMVRRMRKRTMMRMRMKWRTLLRPNMYGGPALPVNFP